jgi:hypothetical protein
LSHRERENEQPDGFHTGIVARGCGRFGSYRANISCGMLSACFSTRAGRRPREPTSTAASLSISLQSRTCLFSPYLHRSPGAWYGERHVGQGWKSTAAGRSRRG